MSSTDNTTSSGSSSASSNDSGPGVTVTSNAELQTPPDTGRPTPPDVIGGDSIHRPGMAPGTAILDGPAAMRVGAHRKNNKTGGSKKS